MSIVILTDSFEFSKQLERTLKKILRSHLEINTDFLVPVSFQNFYTICQNNFIDSIIDSIFIDSSIAKKNQSALNQILTGISPRPTFVLLTPHSDSAKNLFPLIPHYVVRTDHLITDLDRVLQHIFTSSSYLQKIITFQIRDSDKDLRTVAIKLHQLRYLSCEAHRIIFHADREYSHVNSMRYYENYLRPYGFLRTHSKYLVNSHYISIITAEAVILTDQTKIPLSRDRAKDVKLSFSHLTGLC